MRQLSTLLLLLFLSLVGSSQSANDRPLETKLCDVMAKPDSFDGRLVRLRATIVSGFEVFAIKDPREDCQWIWLTYPGGGPSASISFGEMTPSVRRPDITLRQDAEFKKLETLLEAEMHPRDRASICMDCKRFQVTATLTGRIDVAQKGRGFGHLNGYPVQLVLASVTEVSAEDLSSKYDQKLFSAEPVRFPTGYVTGKVADPDGNPVRGIEVVAVPTEADPLDFHGLSNRTDEKGGYKIDVPPGRYIIAANLDSPPSAEFPFPATYCPDSLDRGQAKQVAVSDKQTIDANVRLQTRLDPRRIPVKVIWPDGSVVVDANVWLAEEKRPGRVVGNSVSHTGADGTFELVGFQGISYIVHANIYVKPGYIPHCAEKRLIAFDEPLPERIVMKLTRTGEVCRGDD